MTPKPIWDRLNVELLLTQFVDWLPSLFAAALIFLFFWLLFRATRSALRHLLVRTGFEAALIGMVVNVYRFVLIAFGIVMAASQLGINVGAALAGLGVVGLTIGFAAKDSLSNVMAGFLIFWDKPFHVGEWVTLGEHYGKIAEITMRTTRVQTRDNRWVIIPNASVIDQVLVNHSTNGATRLQIPVGVGYSEEIPKARNAILEAMRKLDKVLQSPAPVVVVNDLGTSSVDLLVFVWIQNAEDEKPVFFAVVEAVKMALDRADVSIPFPQLDLSVKSIEPELLQMAAKEFARVNGHS
jgi:small-conductance mechanosensitive channel